MPQEPVSYKDGAGPCEKLKISFRNGPQNSFGKRKKIVRFCPLWDGCDIYSVPGAWQWDQTSCSYVCPANCGVPGGLPANDVCNTSTCLPQCAANCGGTCPARETCDQASCSCTCNPTTCGAGFVFDTASCQCVCDTTQSCGATRVLDPTTCSCQCHQNAQGVPDCGGCGPGTLCQQSLCQCNPIGG